MPGLSPGKVSELLGIEMPTDPRQSKRLGRWIEGILRGRGEAYLRDNLAEILRQWKHYIKNEFKSCV